MDTVVEKIKFVVVAVMEDDQPAVFSKWVGEKRAKLKELLEAKNVVILAV